MRKQLKIVVAGAANPTTISKQTGICDGTASTKVNPNGTFILDLLPGTSNYWCHVCGWGFSITHVAADPEADPDPILEHFQFQLWDGADGALDKDLGAPDEDGEVDLDTFTISEGVTVTVSAV